MYKAGVRRGVDAFVICFGEEAFYPWLEIWRPGEGFHRSYAQIQDAEWIRLFAGYESALVGYFQVGSGGFFTVTVLMWVDDSYRELTNWTDVDVYYATLGFLDLTDDGWKELVMRTGGKQPSEVVRYRVFQFDPGRLEFLEWEREGPRYEQARTKIWEACERDSDIFDVLCFELGPY